ncbi:MAG: FG-GAP-like repeat-containing protein [Candidatus Altiarchaeota archaeon]
MRVVFLLFLLVSASFVSSQASAPLELVWSQHLVSGANGITLLDFDRDGREEIYTVSLDPSRSLITAYDLNGTLLWDTVVEKPNVYLYPSEEIVLVEVGDLDDDGDFDILAGSQIRSGSANMHFLYRIERERERGLNKLYNRVKWTFEDSRLPTSVRIRVLNDTKTIVFSSNDFNIYHLDANGNLLSSMNLGVSVWDIWCGNLDSDFDHEIVAGTFTGISLLDNGGVNWTYSSGERMQSVLADDLLYDNRSEILAASKTTLYLLNLAGEKIWSTSINDLTSNLLATDLEGDGRKEILVGSGNVLFLFDNTGTIKWRYTVENKILHLLVADINGDSRVDILIGTNRGLDVYRLDQRYLMRESAELYYNLALEKHGSGDYVGSVVSLKESIELYTSLNDTDMISLLEQTLEDYEDDLENNNLFQAAGENLMKARAYVSVNDFENATKHLTEAARIYEKLGDASGLTAVEALNNSLNIKPLAEEYSRKAHAAYLANSFKEALDYAEKAKEIYLELNDTVGLMTVEPIIRLSGEMKNQTVETSSPVPTTLRESRSEEKGYSVIWLFAAVALILLILVARRRLKNKGRGNVGLDKGRQHQKG